MDKLLASKFSSGVSPTRTGGLSVAPGNTNQSDYYSQPGVEIADLDDQLEDPFQNTINLPVRQHHDRLEVQGAPLLQ